MREPIPDGFLRADIARDNASRHLIFASDEQLDLLAQAKTWYALILLQYYAQ